MIDVCDSCATLTLKQRTNDMKAVPNPNWNPTSTFPSHTRQYVPPTNWTPKPSPVATTHLYSNFKIAEGSSDGMVCMARIVIVIVMIVGIASFITAGVNYNNCDPDWCIVTPFIFGGVICALISLVATVWLRKEIFRASCKPCLPFCYHEDKCIDLC